MFLPLNHEELKLRKRLTSMVNCDNVENMKFVATRGGANLIMHFGIDTWRNTRFVEI